MPGMSIRKEAGGGRAGGAGAVANLLAQGDSQVFSPATQFESINSSAFCLLYDPTLTGIYDYC